MAEASPEDSLNISRDTYSPAEGYFALHPEIYQQDHSFDSANSQESSTLHESSDLVTPTISPPLRGVLDREPQGLAPNFLDASGRMSESSNPDQPKAGFPNYRRRPRFQRQNFGSHSPQQFLQTSSYASPSSTTPENWYCHPPSAFQGTSMHYPSPSMTYNSQRSSHVGQYTMSAQANPMPISPPPYAATHAYHYPVGSETNNMNLHVHVNYPNTLQPQTPLLPLQRPSPQSHSFPGMRPTSSPTPPGQAGAGGATYMGFHSLQYPTPMATSPYSYASQNYQSSPVYSPHFSPPSFEQHFSSPNKVEPHGVWFYPSHSPMQQYDSNQHQDPYPAGLSQVRQRYATPPFPHNPPHHSDNQTPSDSPRPSVAGRPSFQGSIQVISSATQSASSNSGRPPVSTGDRAVVRKSYHPNPPAHRSEWVMWAGNVPSDASHDELWRFFNQASPSLSQSSSSRAPPSSSHNQTSGVLSIFLISRSSCAFVNYDTEGHLNRAIARFNGVRLRAHDSRCQPLLCRVRRNDDDLKAGVGGQRGMGMHTNWVKEQKLMGKGKGRATVIESSYPDDLDSPVSPTSESNRLADVASNMAISENVLSENVHANQSSSSGSYASTDSSFLAKYFPRRYFILKSLTQEDLDLSVVRCVWATQRHNEEILDQAYRSSKDVYLIFSVNKSGEFYGYARMSGPVKRGEQPLTWSPRPAPVARVSSPALLAHTVSPPPIHLILPPGSHHIVENSPEPIDSRTPGPASQTGPTPLRHSAPALLGEGYNLPSGKTILGGHSLDHRIQHPRADQTRGGFVLDPDAPTRAMRTHAGSSASGSESGSEHDKVDLFPPISSLRSVEEEEDKVDEFEFLGEAQGDPSPHQPVETIGAAQEGTTRKEEGVWGDAFAIQWITTDRVPFHRTKHLRNSWNHGREIKVSRDGTELEPSVGQRLLEEWASLSDLQNQSPTQPRLGRPILGKQSTNTS